MRYIFGRYDLDTQRYTFQQAGAPVRLEPQVFNVLAYLIRHRDRVVSKQELLDQLWPGQFISDGTLHTRLMAARKAVGDTGRTQQVIQTLRGRGYRFVALVEELDHDAADAQLPPPNLKSMAVPPAQPASPGTASIGPPTGERKLATALYGELADASALAERLGFEALQRLRQAFATQAEQEAQRYGGNIQPFGDDGFLALFGMPVTQEDHARRAVLAALGLQRQLRANGHLKTPYETHMMARFALHTGLVMVGPYEDQAPHAAMAMGETATLAVRLLTLAEPGAILVSEPVMRQVQDTVDGDLRGRLDVFGQSEPIAVYAVRETVKPRMAWPAARPVNRFVGRERELAMLHALLAHVEDGQGQIIGVVGEPGMGKSRVLYEFRQRLADRQITILEGQCVSYGRATPYLPLLDILRQRCGITHADDAATIADKVLQCLRDVSMEPDEDARYLLQLLGLPDETEQLSRLSAQAIKARTFAALHQFLLHSAQQQPLVVMVENLHWVDASSEEWLTLLVEPLMGAPVLLLATYRPGYRPPWIDKSYATQLSLARLTSHDSLAVIQSIPQANGLSEDVAQAILTRAAGNPFFLEELTRAVVEAGATAASPNIPATVQAVLAARIDRLAPTEKHLLQLAAVIGKEAPFALLAAVVELPEEALSHMLLQLQSAEFLYETRQGAQQIYIFKHALTQEAAYQSLLQSARRQIHQRIAQILVEDFASTVEAQPEWVAHHYTEAGLIEPAVGYWQRAGQRAAERFANVEAIRHLTKGLEMLATLPETPQRIQQELRLRMTLGPALMAVQGYASPEVECIYARARILCQQAADTPQYFPVLRGLWQFYLLRAELQTARELGEQLLNLAQRAHDDTLLLEAHYTLGNTLNYLAELTTAQAHLEEGITLYDRQRHHTHALLYGQDPGVCCHAYTALTLWLRGFPDQGLHESHAALALAKDVAHPLSVAFALAFVNFLHFFRREMPLVQMGAESLITLAAEQGLTHWRAIGMMFQGWARATQDQGDAGLQQLCQGLAAWQATEAKGGGPYYLAMLAEVYTQDGQAEAGLGVLAEALALVNAGDERRHEAEIYRLQGELLLHKEGGAQHAILSAETCFNKALDIARRQQAKAWELRSAISLARLRQQQGKRQDAYDLLAPVYGWFTEGFDTADLIDAKTLLDELAS